MSYTFRQENGGLRHSGAPNGLSAQRSRAGGSRAVSLTVVGKSELDPCDGVQREADDAPALLAVVDAQWRMVAVNRNWIHSADRHAYGALLAIGRSYKSFCEWRRMAGSEDAVAVLEAIREIDLGGRTSFFYVSRDETLQLSITSFSIAGARYATICCVEAPRLGMQRGETVLQVEAHERQRLARELHDGAAQYLTGLDLALARLREVNADPAVSAIVQDISGIVDQFHRELKTLTYLRHPPEIDRFGLHTALRLLCTGFAKRTRIHLTLSLHGGDATCRSAVDAAVYRIVQEALSNVYRHARAQHVHVRMSDGAGAVSVVIKDDGVGLRSTTDGKPADCGLGVGIAGMMARAREFGGSVVVRTRRKGGTILSAVIPRPSMDPPASRNGTIPLGLVAGKA